MLMRSLSLRTLLTHLSLRPHSVSGSGRGGKRTFQCRRSFILLSISIRDRMSHSQFNQRFSNSALIVDTFVLPNASFGRGDLGSPQYNLLYAPQMASLQLVTMVTIRVRCIGAWEGIKCGGASFFGNHVTEDSASSLTVGCLRWRKGSGSSSCCDGIGERELGPVRISSAGRARKLWKMADR